MLIVVPGHFFLKAAEALSFIKKEVNAQPRGYRIIIRTCPNKIKENNKKVLPPIASGG
jgi:hypothetical protein